MLFTMFSFLYNSCRICFLNTKSVFVDWGWGDLDNYRLEDWPSVTFGFFAKHLCHGK